jgi:glyoxylase-like metal-dependent hydrolase (beta-lactamase superfamily II)
MMELHHHFDHCTGNWRLVGGGEERLIRCDTCRAELPATPEHRLAAIDENYAGIYLRRLAAEGAAFLDAERGRGA